MTNLPIPPIASRRAHSFTHHDVTIDDPYAWLRDGSYPQVDSPEILSHLVAENSYFESMMAPHAQRIDTLFAEMKARMKEDDSSVPQKDGDWLYWEAFEIGAQYRKWFRKPVAGGDDQLILDVPALAEGKDYYRLGSSDITPDDRILAYSFDDDGNERFTIHFRDLETGAILGDVIPDTLGDIVWSSNGRALLYGVVNENWRVDTIKLHILGTPQSDDIILYHEDDDGFQAGVGMTHSRKYLIISTGNNTTSELRLIAADDPQSAPILVRARQTGVEYDVEEHDGTLFILTNDTHTNFRVVTAPIAKPDDWNELIAPSPKIYLTGLSTFARFFVLESRENGLDQIALHEYGGGSPRRIGFREASYVAGLDDNPEYDVDTLRLSYESMVTPDQVIAYDVASGVQTVLKSQIIPSGYDASRYKTERIEITARDGTAVPVSVVYRNDYVKDAKAPLYVYGYGAYGYAIPPGFSTVRLSLLDRGFAYAIAHIRGGDDLGQQWQLDGKLEKRTNTFNDFVDVTRGLVALGFGAPGRIVAAGGSAGGELIGAVVNSDPDLWGAVAAHVPFVDVLNTMLDDSLPLTPGEFPEWGNPIEDKAAFDLIRSYSPYDQVCAQAYPPMLVTCGLNDPRVTYWEPAKWVAKLRDIKTDDNIILLKTNMGAGHGGKSGRFESLREDAEEIAFFLWQLGIAE